VTILALLGLQKMDEYEVQLKYGEELFTEYVLAPDSEHAAWAALELSTNRNMTLHNVRMIDEW
jgi:hypothetical protein